MDHDSSMPPPDRQAGPQTGPLPLRPGVPQRKRAAGTAGAVGRWGGLLLVVTLAACGRDEPARQAAPLDMTDGPPAATAADAQAIRDSIPGAVLDPSVPSASAVFGAGSEPGGEASAKNQSAPGQLTPSEEGNAMPLPGQANSHSAPAAPASAAAAASRSP